MKALVAGHVMNTIIIFYRYNCYIEDFTIREFKTVHLHFQLSLSMITIRINFEAYSPNNFIKDERQKMAVCGNAL